MRLLHVAIGVRWHNS